MAGLAIAVLCLVLSASFALGSELEAVEARNSAAAAVELRMAAIEVARADQIHELGGEFPVDELAQSVGVLKGDRDSALRALDREESLEANGLLDEIAGCGILLLDPEETQHEAHGHQELEELLGFASESSSDEAARAEKRAAIALLAMSLVAAAAVALVIWVRSRAARSHDLATAQLRAGQRLQALLDDSPGVLLVLDAEDRISYRSASCSPMFGSSLDSMEDLVRLAPPEVQGSLRQYLKRSEVSGASAVFELGEADEESGWFDVRVSDLTQHELVEGCLLTIRDVTNEIRLRSELQHQASTDLLTGVANRRALQPAIDAACVALETTGTDVALMTLDIDGFKTINDSLGHVAGDEVLVQVASRLSKATRSDETLLRLGGDEFAIVASNLRGSAMAELAANRLLVILEEPFRVGGRIEHVRTSIGVAITSDPEHVHFLLGESDIALYEAKRLGGDKVVVFERDLESTPSRRGQITRALREADYDQEFRIVYQPIVTTDTREISTLEALLRWNSPTLGEVRPDEFIPVAEETGEVCSIGRWVMEQVCRQLARWTDQGMDPNISISVNVSPRQLSEATIVSGILGTAHKWGVEPAQLLIEVTESATLDQTGQAQHRLEQLRSAGLRISIDDFGSGYSNLGQLLAVPFDVIKIDRSLLLTLTAMREQAGGDASDPCAIMEAIVSIASILEAPVVCEGVETEEQFASLRASGITHIQGYLTGRPTPPGLITPLICGHSTARSEASATTEFQPILSQVR